MAFVPPWLSFGPLDFVHAAAQGAGLGLHRAQMETGASEAADRLKLGYAQLAGEQARSRMAQDAESERANASLMLHASAQKSALDRFNQALEEKQKDEAARLAFAKEKANQLDTYRTNRLDQFGTEEERKQAALDSLIGYRGSEGARKQSALDLLTDWRDRRGNQIDRALSETEAHHAAAETISADKAAAAIARREATPITFPEFPGMTFIKQPSGAILKVEGAIRSPTVSLDSSGAFKGASGPIGNPAMKALMGTNALPGNADLPANPNLNWTPPPGLPSPAGASLALPQPQSALPSTTAKRVKVIGPNGESGTIEEGDSLPADWKLAE